MGEPVGRARLRSLYRSSLHVTEVSVQASKRCKQMGRAGQAEPERHVCARGLGQTDRQGVAAYLARHPGNSRAVWPRMDADYGEPATKPGPIALTTPDLGQKGFPITLDSANGIQASWRMVSGWWRTTGRRPTPRCRWIASRLDRPQMERVRLVAA